MTTTEVHADIVVPLPAGRACAQLSTILQARDDVGPAGPIRLSVGPTRGGRVLAKHVDVTTRGPRQLTASQVFDLRWEPVGAGAAAYPTLDAKLAVTPIDDASSLLSILGRYEPPFGGVGATADRLAMSRVAHATLTSVLRRLAASLTSTDGVGVST